MKETLKVGLKHTSEITVNTSLTVPGATNHFPSFHDMPPVFATAYLVGFLEATCIEAINPHLDETEHSVGTMVNVSHIAATPAGMKVTANVELVEINNRSLTFKISATDEAGLISEGLHRRAVIHFEKFVSKVGEKAVQYSASN